MKLTQKEIKRFVSLGLAENITNYSFEDCNILRRNADLETVGISTGVYGMNGALLKDRNTGDMYAITARTSSLFQMV